MAKKKQAAILAGVELPPRVHGRPTTEHQARWLEVVEVLMARGCNTAYQLRDLTGVRYETAQRWMKEIRHKWANEMNLDVLHGRREGLYREADQVARIAWIDALACSDDNANGKVGFLKLVIEANKRKAALCGFDDLEIRVSGEIRHRPATDVVQKVEQDLKLAPGALETIGKRASLLLSGRMPDEDKAIEAEVVCG